MLFIVYNITTVNVLSLVNFRSNPGMKRCTWSIVDMFHLIDFAGYLILKKNIQIKLNSLLNYFLVLISLLVVISK